jgi:hypothetical protein
VAVTAGAARAATGPADDRQQTAPASWWSYTGGTTYYAVVETRNTNALSEKLWNVIAPSVHSGKYGFSLKQVGGSTLAACTAIDHDIRCPTDSTHNRTTLTDLGKVYEAFEKGTITTSATWKSEFRSRMLDESNYSGFRNSLCPIVSQEASKLGKSASVATSLRVRGRHDDQQPGRGERRQRGAEQGVPGGDAAVCPRRARKLVS